MNVNINEIPTTAKGLRELAEGIRARCGREHDTPPETAITIVLLEGLAVLHERIDNILHDREREFDANPSED